MPIPPPVPPAERSPYGPDGVPKIAEDVSHRVRHAAERQERDAEAASQSPGDPMASPWLKLAGAAAVGYALGAIIHARPERGRPPAPRRPRPRTMPEPVAGYRSSAAAAAESRPSGVRFR